MWLRTLCTFSASVLALCPMLARAGAAELLPRMSHWRPRRVVYISCHPGSLARDAETLVHTLGFELTCAGVMDMFPHTTHVESIAVFEASA